MPGSTALFSLTSLSSLHCPFCRETTKGREACQGHGAAPGPGSSPGIHYRAGDLRPSTTRAVPPWPPHRADEHPQSSSQTEPIPKMGAGVGHVTLLDAWVPSAPTATAVLATLPLLPALLCSALSSGVSSAPAGNSSLFWAPEPGGTGRTGLLPAGTLLSPGLRPWPR